MFDYDVVVVGGGPAGATAGALLAESGHSVLIVERDRFPRFHIGESLLPEGNVVLDMLGLKEQVFSMGVEKRGATFTHESGRARGSIVFADGIDNRDRAVHVERSEFDRLLLDRSQELGAAVRYETLAREASFTAEGVEIALADGVRLRAKYLIDASGQSGFLAKRFELRRAIGGLENVAVFAHYADVSSDSDFPSGDIEVVSRSDMGWIWLIPINETTTSVGLVTRRDSVAGDLAQREGWLDEALRTSPVVAHRLVEARRTSRVRVAADFSYSCSRYAGERWLLVGDAGSFLDPVFSTGVLLALESGAEAAITLDEILRGAVRESAGLAAFERYQRLRFDFFRAWVEAFYEPAFRDLFCQPSARYGILPAVTSVLAGNYEPGFQMSLKLRLFKLLCLVQKRWPIVQQLHRSDRDS